MRILFVHGMGRTPLSGLPVLLRLRAAGHSVSTFGYCAALQDFRSIRERLRDRIVRLASQGDYALVGHSLGGVLLRSALRRLPPDTNPPVRLFLLGSPIRSARLARKLRNSLFYRAATGDCGQLLASDERMGEIHPTPIKTTSIVGVKGLYGARSPFKDEPNDGVVAVSELGAAWLTDEARVQVVHTFLPSSRRVAEVLLERLGADLRD